MTPDDIATSYTSSLAGKKERKKEKKGGGKERKKESMSLQGVRRPPLPDYLEVRKCFAVHECGKALVATTLRQQTGRLEEVERVSIVPRGRSAFPPPPRTTPPTCPLPSSPHDAHTWLLQSLATL